LPVAIRLVLPSRGPSRTTNGPVPSNTTRDKPVIAIRILFRCASDARRPSRSSSRPLCDDSREPLDLAGSVPDLVCLRTRSLSGRGAIRRV
jgi:hypothetical protein